MRPQHKSSSSLLHTAPLLLSANFLAEVEKAEMRAEFL
jgi:hypothetical protein